MLKNKELYRNKVVVYIIQAKTNYYGVPWTTYSTRDTLDEAECRMNEWRSSNPEIKGWRILKETITTTMQEASNTTHPN